MSDLAELLEALAPVLVQRSLDRMYQNPFWDERFGARGRSFAEQDGRYHITYLAEALRQESPETLVNYARWLQGVLTTRGMCTRHISENFQRLADEIAAAAEEPRPALAYLAQADAALFYGDGPARAVQELAEQVAAEAAALIYRRHPDWLERWGAAGQARCADDMIYHFSYLADSLANQRPELFADYIQWMAGFLARRGIPAAHLHESLQVLEELLARDLGAAGTEASATLRAAAQLLEEGR